MTTSTTANTSPFTLFSTPFPVVSQRVPTRGDEHSLKCGEACAAMIVGCLRGTEQMPTADEVVQAMNSAGRVTSANDIESYLQQKWHIATIRKEITSGENLLWNIWNRLVHGSPVLLTQQFSDSLRTPHWRAVFGLTESAVYLADPWDGTVITQSHGDCYSAYQGAGNNAQFMAILG